jgi:guanylate cyclase
MLNQWKNFVARVRDSITLPGDSESIRIRKTTLTLIVLLIIPGNLIWTLSFISMGLTRAATVNLASTVFYLASTVFLFRTRNFHAYFNITLAFIFVYLVSLQISLGGIVQSGVLMASGLLAPLAASLVLSRRNTIFWAVIYVIVFTGLLAFDETIVLKAPELPANFSISNGFFTVAFVTLLSLAMILYLLRELEVAQNRADTLLFNMLPKNVAARLKEKPQTIAEDYDNASILFADIVGFTPLSNQLSPTEMIELLNQIFSHFDSLVEKYGVEKIRTIGDNYMVASGLPNSRPDHAQALAYTALDMLEYCRNLEPVGGKNLNFRIGINSGPLTAGVIGNKKFQYDVWGDVVNTASRMESHGLPGRIQVTNETRHQLRDDFVLTPRSAINVKGKGEMSTWFLEGKVNQ